MTAPQRPAGAGRPTRRAVLIGAAAGTAVLLSGCGTSSLPSVRVPPQTISYGGDPEQVGDLYVPPTPRFPTPHPVVVLIHGGYWRPTLNRRFVASVIPSLVGQGLAVWNIDYRLVGEGGGWPTTFTDVAAATDALALLARRNHLDLKRVAAVGHSAGGTLALWLGARPTLPSGAPGADPLVPIVAAASLAGVTDLEACATAGMGQGACARLLGGTPVPPGRFALASPYALVPLRIPQRIVQGRPDAVVPVSFGERYAAHARRAGDDVDVDITATANHFNVIDPGRGEWRRTVRWLHRQLGGG